MTQGDRSIKDYVNMMKKAADVLHDVEQVVSPSTLLLNLLSGVNLRFSTSVNIIVGTAGMTFSIALN
jgi:hypothetical protein